MPPFSTRVHHNVGLTALTLLIAAGARAQPQISFATIGTSLDALVPVGSQPALEQDMIAFIARAGTSGPDMLRFGTVGGQFQTVLADGDPTPGLSGGLTLRATNADLHNGTVYFSSSAGLWSWQGGSFTHVYDSTTPGALPVDWPRASNHGLIFAYDPTPTFPSGTSYAYQTSITGHTTSQIAQTRRRTAGVVTGEGDWLCHVGVGPTPSIRGINTALNTSETVTDSSDVVPQVGAPFTGYRGLSSDGARVSFIGDGATGAVCVAPLGQNNAGFVTALARVGQAAPGGGAFSSFDQTACASGAVFFVGVVGSQSGLFANAGGVNHQIIRAGSLFNGRPIIDVNIGDGSADRASVAFRLRYSHASLPGGFGYAMQVATITFRPGDFNADGLVNVQDVFDFLTAWFAGNQRADFNTSRTLTVQDVLDFLAAWFEG